MKTIPIFQVDAFTNKPFSGNPAAVCLLDEPLEDALMQAIAMEMNLSETAFLLPEGKGIRLRWFTPKAEVKLCGHATLASAHVLFEKGLVDKKKKVRFFSRSGELRATQAGGWISLDFPQKPVKKISPVKEILDSVGVRPIFFGKSYDDYLLEVESEEAVWATQPDFPLMAKSAEHGVIVTSLASSPGFDFVSRFFAPALGIPEDPVTGSAHCSLGPYWKGILGKSEFLAFQASSRGGILGVRLEKDRTMISGQAVTVLSGKLVI